MRRIVVVVGLLIASGSAAPAAVLPNDIMVSGQTNIMIIDVDGNGVLGDDNDCVWTATTDGTDIFVVPSQSNVTLRACEGPCSGSGFADSSSAGVVITQCFWNSLSPGAPFVPACLEADESVPSSSSFCGSSPSPVVQPQGGGQGNGVAVLTAARLFYPGFEFIIPDPGDGFLCNAGGPAVQIRTISGRIVVTDITFVGGNPPTHACVKIPFEFSQGGKQLFDACVPITPEGTIEFSVEGGNGPFAVAPLTGLLPACGAGRTAAPSASDLGLVMLALGLLGWGAWTLGRRSGFARSLPLL
jgi:hypothetical protein